MGIVLENLALIIWGPLPVSLPSPVHGRPLRFAGVVVSMHQLFIFATLAVILLAAIFLSDQDAIRDPDAGNRARSAHGASGRHPVNRTIAVAFAFGAVLSGVAGLLGRADFSRRADYGRKPRPERLRRQRHRRLRQSAGRRDRRLVSWRCIETFGARYISSNFRDAYAFIVMIAVLIAWPRGLFGEKSSEKV